MCGYLGRCKLFLERVEHVIGYGHVSGLDVRRPHAAGRYGDAKVGSISMHPSSELSGKVWLANLDLADRLSLLFNVLLTPANPCRATRLGWGLDNPRDGSSSPRSRGQSCLPRQWQPACGVFGRASARASILSAVRSSPPSGSGSWRR